MLSISHNCLYFSGHPALAAKFREIVGADLIVRGGGPALCSYVNARARSQNDVARYLKLFSEFLAENYVGKRSRHLLSAFTPPAPPETLKQILLTANIQELIDKLERIEWAALGSDDRWELLAYFERSNHPVVLATLLAVAITSGDRAWLSSLHNVGARCRGFRGGWRQQVGRGIDITIRQLRDADPSCRALYSGIFLSDSRFNGGG